MRRALSIGAFVAVTLAAAVLTAGAMQWASDTAEPVLPGPVVLEPATTAPAPLPASAGTPDPIEVRPAPERLDEVMPPGSAPPGSSPLTTGPRPTTTPVPVIPPSTGVGDTTGGDDGADDGDGELGDDD